MNTRRKEDVNRAVQEVMGEWDEKAGELLYTYEFDAFSDFGVKRVGSIDYGNKPKDMGSFTASFKFKNLPEGTYIIKLERLK